MTAVDKLSAQPHGQKIVIVLGPSKGSLSINAINYVQVLLSVLRPVKG